MRIKGKQGCTYQVRICFRDYAPKDGGHGGPQLWRGGLFPFYDRVSVRRADELLDVRLGG